MRKNGKTYTNQYSTDNNKGLIFSVDFEYPEDLYDQHNLYPFAPKKKARRPHHQMKKLVSTFYYRENMNALTLNINKRATTNLEFEKNFLNFIF